jgi:hypothetical protein
MRNETDVACKPRFGFYPFNWRIDGHPRLRLLTSIYEHDRRILVSYTDRARSFIVGWLQTVFYNLLVEITSLSADLLADDMPLLED